MHPRSVPASTSLAPAARRQARYWNLRFRTDPSLFGERPSAFLRWVFSSLRGRSVGPSWVELGSGYGRDLRELRDRGLFVRGVEVSHVGISLAGAADLHVEQAHALPWLEALPAASVDVVFSNLFYNMEFTETDHGGLFSAVERALLPGGYHAYSARSTKDPWYGKGRRVGAATYDLRPDGPVMHFFSPAYASRLRRGRFRRVREWEGPEDQGRFPTRVLYVLERKSPRAL